MDIAASNNAGINAENALFQHYKRKFAELVPDAEYAALQAWEMANLQHAVERQFDEMCYDYAAESEMENYLHMKAMEEDVMLRTVTDDQLNLDNVLEGQSILVTHDFCENKWNEKEWRYDVERGYHREFSRDENELIEQKSTKNDPLFPNASPRKRKFHGTLQDICKQCIAANLHLYDEKNLRTFPEYLDRVSWDHILHMAVKYPTVTAAIIYLYCNVHTEKSNTLQLENLNLSAKVVWQICSSDFVITEINLSYCDHLPEDTFEVIPILLPFIKVIKCRATKITSRIVMHIANRCKNLEHLDVRNTSVDAKSLTLIFRKCVHLTGVLVNESECSTLAHWYFEEQGVHKSCELANYIAAFFNGHEHGRPSRVGTVKGALGSSGAKVNYQVGVSVYGLYSHPLCNISGSRLPLSHLYLNGPISEMLCYTGGHCLTTLHIYGCSISHEALNRLLVDSNLEDIKLSSCLVAPLPDLYTSLLQHKRLHSLGLIGVQPKGTSMKDFFRSFTKCAIINLELEYLDKEGCKEMATICRNLQKLILYEDCNLQESLLGVNFSELSVLQLFKFEFTQELCFKILYECRNLQDINFAGHSLPTSFFHDLFWQSPFLEIVRISSFNFDDVALYNLVTSHPNLRSIEISGNCLVSEFGLFLVGRYCNCIRHFKCDVPTDTYGYSYLRKRCTLLPPGERGEWK